jgi:hypothetical protein
MCFSMKIKFLPNVKLQIDVPSLSFAFSPVCVYGSVVQ